MANIKSAVKRAIQSEKRKNSNVKLKSMYRTHIKKVVSEVNNNNKDEATKNFKESVSVIDKVASKGIIHKNKAARHKSRLNKKIKKLS